MERLTKRDPFDGIIELTKEIWEPIAPYNEVMEALSKLAAYEDAEEQGRLVVLSGIKNHANAIRRMTDKELAAWLAFVETKILEKQPKLERAVLKEDWLDWLKQEVESEALKGGSCDA